jgi:hypothetical protein
MMLVIKKLTLFSILATLGTLLGFAVGIADLMWEYACFVPHK